MGNTTIKRQPWWRRVLGEISVLRGQGLVATGFWTPYVLDASRVDYRLTQALYRNTEDRYKLGAGFAKPIINATSGFMGMPRFRHDTPEAHDALQRLAGLQGQLLRINRNTLRDGDVFARLEMAKDRFGQSHRLHLRLVPPGWVTPILDPITGAWRQVVIRHPVRTIDSDGRMRDQYTITETLTPDTRTVLADARAPAEVRAQNREEPNPWGFIPLVHFRNEAEEDQLWGSSDLEAVEPFFRAYHDVMLSAVQGSKLFSRPKAKFQLTNVEQFLTNNFTPEEIKTGKLRFDNREIYFLQQGDDASFISADDGMDGITTLLKFLYMCIVDTSETPEFAFGTAVQSSRASVGEQMVAFVRKIDRKRGQFAEPYGELASMYLAMWSRTESITLDSTAVTVEWDEVNPRDDKAAADTITQLVQGLSVAVETGMMSLPAAAETLREYVPAMLPWDDPEAETDESRRVAETMERMLRLQDPEGMGRGKDE